MWLIPHQDQPLPSPDHRNCWGQGEFSLHLSAVLLTESGSERNCTGTAFSRLQRSPGRPAACREIFGQSIQERVIERLQNNGIREISLLPSAFSRSSEANKSVAADGGQVLSRVTSILANASSHGVSSVLIAKVGAYAEFNVERVLKSHRAAGRGITALCDRQGRRISYWVVNAAGTQAEHLRRVLDGEETDVTSYCIEGYVNHLETARDFRQLVVDSFLGRCAIHPSGKEIKPGVWAEKGAFIERRCRLVAPVYVGRRAMLGDGSVITRFSNVEENCRIGRESLVSNSSVMPYTAIGAGLDVTSSVVDGKELIHVGHDVAMTIHDPALIGDSSRVAKRWGAVRPREKVNYQPSAEPDSSQYGSRTAGRVFEVFKGEA